MLSQKFYEFFINNIKKRSFRNTRESNLNIRAERSNIKNEMK